jgi:hypothetical protein
MLVRHLRPAPSPETVVRFESPAGHQAQVDFAEFQFPWGTRYALLVVLAYSRLLWCRFGVRQDMRTLLTLICGCRAARSSAILSHAAAHRALADAARRRRRQEVATT